MPVCESDGWLKRSSQFSFCRMGPKTPCSYPNRTNASRQQVVTPACRLLPLPSQLRMSLDLGAC